MTSNARAELRRALLSPRSVVIVGQSNDAGKASGRPLNFLRRAGFGGTVYSVNARRETVLGERAYPSVSALPEVPEHAYILVPTEAVIDAVAECGKAGVRIATILAAGFSETGRGRRGARAAPEGRRGRNRHPHHRARRASAS